MRNQYTVISVEFRILYLISPIFYKLELLTCIYLIIPCYHGIFKSNKEQHKLSMKGLVSCKGNISILISLYNNEEGIYPINEIRLSFFVLPHYYAG